MDLLAKDGSVTIHTRNLQVLATEMFKVYWNVSTELMQELHYNLRNPHYFGTCSAYHGSERISVLEIDLEIGT